MENTHNVPSEELKDTTEETVETPNNQEAQIDYENILKSKDELIVKLETERENYRRGMLKAKKEAQDNGEPQDNLDEIIEKKVQEKLLESQIFQAQKEKEDALKQLIKENKELRVAINNKAGISVSGGGSEKPASTQGKRWVDSPEFIAYVEKREKQLGLKLDREEYWKNWQNK